MEYESREGVDYIVDLYAIAGVSHEAAEGEIKDNIREQLKQYHPDRLEGLAPEFRDTGERMAKLLNRANVILLDADKRQEYDQLFNKWTGPVSENGLPIVNIDRLWHAELQGKSPEEVEELIQADISKMSKMLSHSPHRLDFFKKLVADANGEPNAQLRTEYEIALLQHDSFLAVQLARRSEIIGISSIWEERNPLKEGYAAAVEERVEEARKEHRETGQQLALGSIGTRLALLAGDTPTVTDGQLDACINLAITAYFDDQAAKVRGIAKEREEIMEARLENLTLDYPSPELQETFIRKLALGIIEKNSAITWLGVAIGTDNTASAELLPESIERLLIEEDFESAIASGYNVARVRFMDRIDMQELVSVAIGKYVDDFSKSDSK